MQAAAITSLIGTIPVCIVGAFGHYKRKNVDLNLALVFAFSGVLGAFIGAKIIRVVSSDQLKIAFGIYSVLIAVNMAFNTWRVKKNEKQEKIFNKDINHTPVERIKSLFFGLLAGIITGTFGTSGTASILAGLFSMRMPLKTVIGTSLLVVLANTLFAVGVHSMISKINFILVFHLTLGSTIGALIGPKFLMKLEIDRYENKLRYWYASVILTIGLLMIIS